MLAEERHRRAFGTTRPTTRRAIVVWPARHGSRTPNTWPA